jgi:group I intron endonuclease
MIVYEAKFPNGKRYIGQTVKALDRRVIEHKHAAKYNTRRVYSAARKYGWENIVWTVLVKCDTIEEMNETEINLIKKYKTLDKKYGYNMREGGEGGRHSEETKQILREKLGGKNNPMADKDPWNKGKKLSKEHREHLSQAHMGQTPWNKGMKGQYKRKPQSQETIESISKKNSGEGNGMAKLTADQVREMRRIYDNKEMTLTEIAEKYGLNKNYCGQVCRRKVWKSVKEDK